MAMQQYNEGDPVWVNVGAPGQESEWRPATIAAGLDDGRYRVYQLSTIGGPEEVIVGAAYLHPRQEGEEPPAAPTPVPPSAPPVAAATTGAGPVGTDQGQAGAAGPRGVARLRAGVPRTAVLGASIPALAAGAAVPLWLRRRRRRAAESRARIAQSARAAPMIGRFALLSALLPVGWLAFRRLRQQPATQVNGDAGAQPEGERGGLRAKVSQVVTTAPAAARRAAERLRPLMPTRRDTGGAAAATPATPEIPAQTVPPSDPAAGYTPGSPAPSTPPVRDTLRPVVAPSDSVPGSGGGAGAAAPGRGGAVKGNIRTTGEKIYHLPGDPSYEETIAEETFTSAAEAEAAGYRPAQQQRPTGP